MADILPQLRRTSVAGRAANSTTLPNPGQLALNMADRIMYSTDGTNIFEIGANVSTQRIGNSTQYFIGNSTGIYPFSNTAGNYSGNSISRWNIYSENINISGDITLAVSSGITANSSKGTAGQALLSNGTSAYWGSVVASAAPGGADTEIQFNDNDLANGLPQFTFTKGTSTVTMANAVMTNKLLLAAGTTTITPLKFQSGTLNTTAANGNMEYDGKILYFSPFTSQRSVIPTKQWMVFNAPFTVSSNGSGTVQRISNSSSTGALTVMGDTTYLFEGIFNFSSMSSTSGNLRFDLKGAGTATIANAAFFSIGLDATTLTTGAAVGGSFNPSSNSVGNLSTAATGTGYAVMVKGIARISATGTVIPSIAMTNGVFMVIGTNGWFYMEPIGSSTITTIGNWS